MPLCHAYGIALPSSLSFGIGLFRAVPLPTWSSTRNGSAIAVSEEPKAWGEGRRSFFGRYVTREVTYISKNACTVMHNQLRNPITHFPLPYLRGRGID
ncbi:hypothetical protein BX600DRAFT_474920 [Xylariales sp. PMI_506]|nr:hypothetical protein BX600DRAFT_474920 [Xylariales sp. PMI_506]